MGERLLCKQEVDGSIPFTSTRAMTGGRSGKKVLLIDRVKRVVT